jgi:hypothetical protein
MFLHFHGERRIQILKVDNGRSEVKKPTRLCLRHGWVDEFLWKRHEHCDRKPEAAEFTPQLAKAA